MNLLTWREYHSLRIAQDNHVSMLVRSYVFTIDAMYSLFLFIHIIHIISSTHETALIMPYKKNHFF